MLLTMRQTLVFALIVVVLSSCSNSEEKEKTGAIEQTTDKIAQEAVETIKKPIEQARMAKELVEIQNRSVEKAVEQ
jgi:hypothetical protein